MMEFGLICIIYIFKKIIFTIKSNVECMVKFVAPWLAWKYVASQLVSSCFPHRKDTLVQFKP